MYPVSWRARARRLLADDGVTTSLLVRSLLRIAACGVIAALVALGLGVGLDRWHFGGSTDDAALLHIAATINARVADTARTLDQRAAAARVAVDLLRRPTPNDPSPRELFLALERSVQTAPAGGGITVFDAGAAPAAWAWPRIGPPRERIDGPASTFAARSTPAARAWAWVEPVFESDRPGVARFVTLVIEQNPRRRQRNGRPAGASR